MGFGRAQGQVILVHSAPALWLANKAIYTSWKMLVPKSDILNSIDAQRICVIKPSALGDVVQSLPILRAIKSRFPNAEITWVIGKSIASILDGHPHIDHQIHYVRKGGLRDSVALLRQLKRSNFDLVFDLQGLLRTGIMTAATMAKYRVGLETAREGSHLTYNVTIPNSGRDVPAHERYWKVAEALGAGQLSRDADLAISESDRDWAIEYVREAEQKTIVLNPGTRWLTKRWPTDKFAEIAERTYDKVAANFAIIGSPDERELSEQLHQQMLQRNIPADRITNLAGKTSLKQLAAVLEQADIVVTNDSGPMHLAHAVGSRVVGIFLCTSAERSGPPAAGHRLVSTSVSCAASYKKQCPMTADQHQCCMAELNVDRVWRAVSSLLSQSEENLSEEPQSEAA